MLNYINDNIKTSILTVTYGNRFKYLVNLLNSLELEKKYINELIIIDNGSESNNELIEYQKKSKLKITHIRFHRNMGSAFGFKYGIQYCIEKKENFLYLIDDDNYCNLGSIYEILKKTCYSKDKIFYFSLRKTSKKHLKILQNKETLVIQKNNKILNFGYGGNLILVNKNSDKNLVQYVPYSGLMLRMADLDIRDLPNEKYYLYQDDTDFTYRLFRRGITFKLCEESIIEDQDNSWGELQRKFGVNIPNVLNLNTPNLKVYYSIRNRILFEKKYKITNNYIYLLNALFLLILLVAVYFSVLILSKRYRVRIRLIITSILHGIKNKEGENYNI